MKDLPHEIESCMSVEVLKHMLDNNLVGFVEKNSGY